MIDPPATSATSPTAPDLVRPRTAARAGTPGAAPTSSVLLTLAVLGALAGRASTQGPGSPQFSPLGGQRLPPHSGITRAVAGADFDGDGDLDLLCGNRLYRNDGDGNFVDVSATHLPQVIDGAFAVGDVDGDGDLDIAVGNWGQSRLLLNDGSGSFQDAPWALVPALVDTTTSIALGDLDGDGDLDLVVGNHHCQICYAITGQNRVYLNDGAGTFTEAAGLPMALDETTAVALGDVDGDGDLDLVTSNVYGDCVLWNDGSGQFSTAQSLTSASNAIALHDVDADGDLDLVFAKWGQNRLYLNDGNGSFSDVTASHLPAVQDSTHGVALADVDGDGDPDLVFGNAGSPTPIRLCTNDGSGVFTDAGAGSVSAPLGSALAVAFADVDGDQDQDLVVGMAGATLWTPAVDTLLLNLHRQLDVPAPLRIGQPFAVDVHVRNTPAGAIDLAVPYLSTTRVSIPIPPLGTLRIVPELPLGHAVVAATPGVASFTGTVPNLPSLVGLEVHAQALVLSTGAADRLTNVGTDIVAW